MYNLIRLKPKENIIIANQKRVEWIDIFKGIGILLVVIGHSTIPKELSWWIWSFHMPLFFTMSSYQYFKI
ncbi:fucose 4-O-acetylase-like acetyltransferase [Wenyingzhuangia aestuarii]|nr:fucose 4-O-acetylase-like acetyltransferase [Wenyingzhuangia aestuarii]